MTFIRVAAWESQRARWSTVGSTRGVKSELSPPLPPLFSQLSLCMLRCIISFSVKHWVEIETTVVWDYEKDDQHYEAVILIAFQVRGPFLMSKPFTWGWKEGLTTKGWHRGTFLGWWNCSLSCLWWWIYSSVHLSEELLELCIAKSEMFLWVKKYKFKKYFIALCR